MGAPPENKSYKLNFDGAERGNPGQAGSGGDKGQIEKYFIFILKIIGKASIKWAEGIALIEGMKLLCLGFSFGRG